MHYFQIFLTITLWADGALLSNHHLKARSALENLVRIPFQAAKPTAQARVSILIALYRETEMVDQLIKQIRCLAYPSSPIEVFLLTEQSDAETHAAVTFCDLPENVTLLSCHPAQL